MVNCYVSVLNSNTFVLMAKSHFSSDNEGAGGRAVRVDTGKPHNLPCPSSTRGNEMIRLSLSQLVPTLCSASLPCACVLNHSPPSALLCVNFLSGRLGQEGGMGWQLRLG